ncbi:family 20 glycosylhydrolase [Mucilaginibacter sp. UR6-11]|uniref:family 20 glycosylhydrolase n=1 Tax=Mucilaginibacter sp. UR6-11 TaxID=1435644 RepID=UPI001E29DEC6|nr:family 20 glycosylhydrolase [Mucilaginibacter sp. UR6-11]MCC8425915.1 family 20 glycosylhydrolase [Mucilaginibacter sp. UR6-11]
MYKKIFLLLVAFFSLSLANAQDKDPNVGIIPAPVSVKKASGTFILSQETQLFADSVDNKAVVFLSDYLKNTAMLHMPVKLNSGNKVGNSVVLTSAGTDGLPAEGYRLTITPTNITIAAKGAGLFYGIQTLIQLIPADKGAVARLPCVQIEDYPRFGYRGLMLDVCRHFFSVQFVKKYIDLMAAYKLNTFHWHLTDDQGWRIEIKKYPKLTEIGSRRAETVIGNYHDRTPQQYDNTPYGGYYTQDEIRDVVKYAADRYITVVPEIEMPGHAMAALASYPELGCEPTSGYQVQGTWGIFRNVYCPSEKTFAFLEDVLTEVMALFPSKYIHIGGDEAPKDVWKESKFCQQLIKKLKLKDEHGLQSYFIQRIEKFVNSKGRSIIGWDEILEGGLAPNATVMSWRGEQGGIDAAKQNHDVIMTPGSGGMYIDAAQGKLSTEPLSIGGFTPLVKTYRYDPTPEALNADQKKHILGVQANMWTEYIATENKIEYMLLPRMLALAEVAWTPLANKNFTDFSEVRLPSHLAWLDKNGFDYRVPTAIGAKDTVAFGNQLTVNLKPSVKGAKVYYTIDGYTPRETDIEFNLPVTYNVPADQYRELQTIVITPTGKRSVVTKMVVYNKAPLPPVNYSGNSNGLRYQIFPGEYNSTGEFKLSADGADSLISKSFNINPFRKMTAFGVIYTGYIRVDTDGVYGFGTSSDDGSTLLVDDQLVVDNDGKHPVSGKNGAIALQKGYHRFTVKYFNIGTTGSLKVFITLPGKPTGELGSDLLYN